MESSPNYLEARIFNLSPETVKRVRQYGRVQLAAGYESNYGMLFDGTVILYIVGKENPVDSYIDIRAADGDELTTASVGLTWYAGSTPKQRTTDMLKAAGAKVGEVNLGKAGDQKSLRSTSFIGMLDRGIRAITNAAQGDFFLDDGKAYVISWSGYRKDQVADIVELSPTTGLVGIPKVTPQGIECQCLLNPKLRLGGLVKISTSLISDIPYLPGAQNPFADEKGQVESQAAPTSFRYPAAGVNPAKDTEETAGWYKILFLDHRGDTRGNTWYSYLVCCAAGKDGEYLPGTYSGTALKRSVASSKPGG
jgi:hypothetical protein